jgi:hypothetical protein
MKLFYNIETQNWFQIGQGSLTFGGQKETLYSSSISADDVHYRFQLKDQHVGPLIGIMSSPKNESSLAGNLHLFTKIQSALLSRDALSFVFSYRDVYDDGRINGYIYMPNQNKWIRAIMPFPDIVYNRIPFRKSETTSQFKKCIQIFKENQIPMFNPGFIDKYDLFQILISSQKLKKYLPDTVLIDSIETLKEFFNKYSDIYLKPRLQSKGKNVFRLYGNFILESNNQSSSFSTLEKLCNDYDGIFMDGTFIAQRTIKPDIIDGNRYDFRILSHWSTSLKNYSVTGVGIRASKQHQITTHLAYGGVILPYEEIQCSEHDHFISDLVKEIGSVLTKKLGFFGEFSIDAGVDSEGNYVLYEVNSKPMSFDEEEIEQTRISNLCDLFFYKTGFEM